VTIELDEWDLAWLARPHTEAEYKAEIKSALLRCAAYSARIDRLEAELEQQRGGCGYPGCMVDGRCARMWAGECAGPRRTQL
jgi:hypothetical protein